MESASRDVGQIGSWFILALTLQHLHGAQKWKGPPGSSSSSAVVTSNITKLIRRCLIGLSQLMGSSGRGITGSKGPKPPWGYIRLKKSSDHLTVPGAVQEKSGPGHPTSPAKFQSSLNVLPRQFYRVAFCPKSMGLWEYRLLLYGLREVIKESRFHQLCNNTLTGKL